MKERKKQCQSAKQLNQTWSGSAITIRKEYQHIFAFFSKAVYFDTSRERAPFWALAGCNCLFLFHFSRFAFFCCVFGRFQITIRDMICSISIVLNYTNFFFRSFTARSLSLSRKFILYFVKLFVLCLFLIIWLRSMSNNGWKENAPTKMCINLSCIVGRGWTHIYSWQIISFCSFSSPYRFSLTFFP